MMPLSNASIVTTRSRGGLVGGGGWRCRFDRVGPCVDIDTFEFRFASILDRTARDWVNVHVESIEAGALKLVVEYRTDAAGVPRTWTAAEISVNLSGPIKSWWDGLPVSE